MVPTNVIRSMVRQIQYLKGAQKGLPFRRGAKKTLKRCDQTENTNS